MRNCLRCGVEMVEDLTVSGEVDPAGLRVTRGGVFKGPPGPVEGGGLSPVRLCRAVPGPAGQAPGQRIGPPLSGLRPSRAGAPVSAGFSLFSYEIYLEIRPLLWYTVGRITEILLRRL